MTRYFPCVLSMLLCVLAVSCTTARHAQPQLPSDVRMNSDAGLGNLLILTIHLEDGEELPVVMDTGDELTCLDKSLEGKLGKPRGTETAHHFGDKLRAHAYTAPRLYLGQTLLKKSGLHGSYVVTIDCTNVFSGESRPIMGILGMDILRNYCIQLDFNARQVRFLDAAHSDKQNWGTAFRLTKSGACFTVRSSLAGTNSPPSLIDTGDLGDGWLTPTAFERWTNQTKVAKISDPWGPTLAWLTGLKNDRICGETIHDAPGPGPFHFSNATLNGLDYSNVDLSVTPSQKVNGIGLLLLARNLVTLDFPHRKMYLKQMSCKPLFDESENMQEGFKFLINLLDMHGLPGLPEHWAGNVNYSFPDRAYPFSGTFVFTEKGQPSTFHYAATKASGDSAWKLMKAWKSDPSGNIVKEYPIAN